MVHFHPYFPSVMQGPNLRSDVQKGRAPLPFYYESWLPLKLFVGGQIISYVDNLILGGALSSALPLSPALLGALASFVILIMWSRVCVWTHSLWPPAMQSNHCAVNKMWESLTDIRASTSHYLVMKTPEMQFYKDRRIPILLFLEEYKKGNIDLVEGVDLQDMIRDWESWAFFALTWEYAHFIVTGYFVDIVWHDKNQDHGQVTEHYNTGNDFFGWFLGPRMLYTSGYFQRGDETLEEAQDNKLELVCKKLQLKKDMTLLDLGCGWGAWVLYVRKRYQVKVFGLSIAKEQIQFCKNRAEKSGIKGAEWLCRDYRDMPTDQAFDRITCFEMSEHVGVKRYPEFLQLVKSALSDDGIFYLQIAGLREQWQHEDVAWGIFMYRYIFRGADASLPLNWVVSQLECAGFEVHSVETIGTHYADTIKLWYSNWMKNKKKVLDSYGREYFRIYEYFLASSAIIPEKGCSTCFQLVCHKQLDDFDRTMFYGEGQKIFPLAHEPFNELKSGL